MVKIQGFKGLTFQKQLYQKWLKKDMQHLQSQQSQQTNNNNNNNGIVIQNIDVQQLLQQGVLNIQSKPSLYLYSQQNSTHISYGIITELSVKDYLNNKIKQHQETLNRQQQNLNNQTIVQKPIAPVVVAHRHCQQIDDLIEEITSKMKAFVQWKTVDERKHRVWVVKGKYQEMLIQKYAKLIKSMYILDGHHRFKAASQHLKIKQQQQTNQNSQINEKDNFILGIVYSSKYVIPYPQHRQLTDSRKQQIVEQILNSDNLTVTEVQPQCIKQKINQSPLLLIHNHKCLEIKMKDEGKNKKDKKVLLGSEMLIKIFSNLSVPHKNKSKQTQNSTSKQQHQHQPQIQYLPSIKLDLSSQSLLTQHNNNKNPLFLINTPSIQQIFQYADNNKSMPPKSTWLEPKPCLSMVIRLPY